MLRTLQGGVKIMQKFKIGTQIILTILLIKISIRRCPNGV
jgi:hypothetical protein